MTCPFQPAREQYMTYVVDHLNELDLADHLSPERREEQPYHAVCLVRRLYTDRVFPYDTATFLQWYALKQNDPLTRADLRYLSKYVAYKRMCWEKYADVLTSQVTRSFLLEVLDHWWQDRLALENGTHETVSLDLEHQARAFIDPWTLHQGGMVHDMNAEQATQFLLPTKAEEKRWMLRRSSQQGSMRDVEILTVSCRTPRGVRHSRFLVVRGVGVCSANDRQLPSTFAEFFDPSQLPDMWGCVVDVLLEVMRRWQLAAHQFIKVEKNLVCA